MPRKRSSGDYGLYYLKSKKLWRAVADDGEWPDGRRKQISATARLQQDAKKKLAAKLAEIEEFGAVLDKRTTMAEWSQTWLDTICRPHMKPNGLKAYESVTRTWITPVLGRRIVGTVKPSDVRNVLQGITKAGRSSSTSLKAYGILNGMLEAARLEGLAKRNVVQDVQPPKAAVSDVRALTAQEARAVLLTSQTDADGSRWWAAILDGLRQGERLGAQISNLDFQNGRYKVEWALTEITSEHGCGAKIDGMWACGKTQGAACPSTRLKLPDGLRHHRLAGRLCLVPPKSGRERTIPVPTILLTMLRDYINSRAHLPNPHGLIWRNNNGSPITPKQDEQAWRDLLYRAGLIIHEQSLPPKDRPEGTEEVPGAHAARHTTATVMMELGVDAKIVGEIVGHQSERVTRGYQHVTSAAAADASDRLSDHFAAQLAIES